MEYIQEIVALLEETAVAYLPRPHEISILADKFVDDLWRYGPLPFFSSISLPSLPRFAAFEVPPPPPPLLPTVPIPQPWHESTQQLAGRHAKVLVGGTIFFGVGLLLWNRAARQNRLARQWNTNLNGAKEVIVILGADSAFGGFLLQAFTKRDYILIVSVANPKAAEPIERKGRGLVKALVLDPSDGTSAATFLRSLKSALSLRFPLHVAGDPYSSSSKRPNRLVSVISLLSLAEPPEPQPIEQIPLSSSYLLYHQATLITPLSIIQALLPLLRISTTTLGKRDCSVVCLVPAAARAGVPLYGCQAMASASLVTSLEVLRRELAAVDSDTRVVIVDVGSITNVETPHIGPAYSQLGPSEGSMLSVDFTPRVHRSHKGRKPSELNVLEAVVHSVLGQRLESPKHRFWTWFRGDHFSIGAGAGTYAFVPRVIPRKALDLLLVLPIQIVSLRRPSTVKSDSDHSHLTSQEEEGVDLERRSKVGDSWVNLAEGV